MITPEDVERIEEQKWRYLEALQGRNVVKPLVITVGTPQQPATKTIETDKPQPPRPEFRRGNVSLVVTPVELISLVNGHEVEARARALKVEQTRPSSRQSQTITFEVPIKVTPDSICVQVKGKCRSQPGWKSLDPWVLISSKPEDRRLLRSLRARSGKQ